MASKKALKLKVSVAVEPMIGNAIKKVAQEIADKHGVRLTSLFMHWGAPDPETGKRAIDTCTVSIDVA